MEQLRSGPRWPADLGLALAWYQPHLERLHDDAHGAPGRPEQLQRMASGHASRERFVTELTLDPPEASSDEAGPPQRRRGLPGAVHHPLGQGSGVESVVHILNVVDGCMPADMATGHAAEIEEERRLLYVAMTRARDRLDLWVPQRFHVTRAAALGRSAFVWRPLALRAGRTAGSVRSERCCCRGDSTNQCRHGR
jgi:DNA helicase-2/ATP-dependent DNA helicase PcrA